MALQIPQTVRPSIIHLASVSSNEKKVLIDALNKVKPTLNFRAFSSQVATTSKLDPRSVEKSLRALFSIYALLDQTSMSAEDIAEEVTAALRVLPELPENIRNKEESFWKNEFPEFVSEALSLHDTLGISSKATRVQTEHQRLFENADILTDIRVVFRGKTVENPRYAIIIHTMNIRHFEHGEYKEFFIALDSNDLVELEKIIQRAKEKERVLLSLCNNSELQIINIDNG